MNASMKTMLNLSVLTFLLVAAPRQCSALVAIVDVSKAQAKEMGVTIRSQKNGDEGVMVCVEFKIQGVLKDFDHVELRIAAEGKLGGKYLVSAPLLAKRRTEGSVSACFSADPSYLALSELWIVVPKPQGGTGYRLKVKDFIESEFVAPVPNMVRLKLGASIPLAIQSAGVVWRGDTYHLVRLGSIRFELDENDCLKADIQAGVTGFDNVDYDISGAVFDAAGQLLGTARAQCKVQRGWAGNVERTAQTIRLDFGVSLDYTRAASFMVSVSNRKVLTPDEWQK